MNEALEGRQAFRIIKGADRLKSGVITLNRKDGSVVYRCPCDRCTKEEEVPFAPKEGREFLCHECMRIDKKGKSSTRHVMMGNRSRFVTACDECGREETTDFMPFRDRHFLCSLCFKDARDKEEEADSR